MVAAVASLEASAKSEKEFGSSLGKKEEKLWNLSGGRIPTKPVS
jgi:hypothetical protein